jgi:hypothetical protein
MQMTSRTAKSIGFHAPDFLSDPFIAGAAAVAYFDTIKPKKFEDAVSYWNAGVPKFENLPPGNSARTDYYPKALSALDWVTRNPPG